jgi:MFS family permease
VRGNPILRTILASWGLVTVTIGAINVTQVVIAKEAYETGDLGFGFFVGAEAVGIVLGNVVAPALIARLGTRRSYAVGFGVMALGVVGAAASPGIVPATVAAAVHGVGNGIGLVTNLSLLQRAVTDDMRGRAFAFMGSVLSVTALAGMIAAGPITEWAGSRALWNGLGVTLAFVAVAVLAARALQHGDEAPTPSPAPADGAPQADEAGRS